MTSHKDPLWYLKTSRVLFYEPVKQIFPPGQWTDTAAWERESILYPGHCAADVGLTRSVCSCCAAHCDLGFNQRLVCQGVTLTSFLCCWAWLTPHSSRLTSAFSQKHLVTFWTQLVQYHRLEFTGLGLDSVTFPTPANTAVKGRNPNEAQSAFQSSCGICIVFFFFF